LRFTLPFDKVRAGSVPVTVSLSNRARLASGAFYEAVLKARLLLLITGSSHFF